MILGDKVGFLPWTCVVVVGAGLWSCEGFHCVHLSHYLIFISIIPYPPISPSSRYKKPCIPHPIQSLLQFAARLHHLPLSAHAATRSMRCPPQPTHVANNTPK